MFVSLLIIPIYYLHLGGRARVCHSLQTTLWITFRTAVVLWAAASVIWFHLIQYSKLIFG